MSIQVVLVVFCVLMVLVGFGAMLVGGKGQDQTNRILAAQRDVSDGKKKKRGISIFETAEEAKVGELSSARLTLEKKLRFAQINIPVFAFRFLEFFISITAFLLVSLKFNLVLTCMALLAGPLVMGYIVNNRMMKRSDKFDEDYPSFLLSLVSLLKTGMNTMTAIETAARGLEDASVVKEELVLMMERLRFGVSEEKSIGAFGEDIFHSEIELFVQALLLSRRVGGNLSETLDRLAKQVRKRQHFRAAARAAVGMQRGSIWFILGIMAGMETYLYFVYPEAVVNAIQDPLGWQVWQFGIIVILLGIYWVNQVTKIKI